MTGPPPDGPGLAGHELLLRLAGRIPDDGLARARRLLAGGDVRGAVSAVARWLAAEPVPLLAAELAAIRALAGDPGALPGYPPEPAVPALPFAFSALDGHGEVGRDALDDAVAAVAEGHRAAGLWRSWRYPLDGPGDDPDQAYRVYLAQVEDAGMIADLTRDLLRAVDDTGRTGTEVILLSVEPPPYQALALAASMLLWASPAEPEFGLAAVFDFADPVSGPGFAPDHAVVDDPDERARILAYLGAGVPVLMTTVAMPDVLDPAAGAVVPANFRTDGEWIWTDTVGYYLSRHGLAPEARLTEHIGAMLARGQTTPAVDDETAGRAADFLLNPLAADPARG
jgi:hypothetical protein